MSRVAWPERRASPAAGWLNADTTPARLADSAEDTNRSVLSSIRATRGLSPRSTRLEKFGGIVRTPLTRPSRRSRIAVPWSAYITVSKVRALAAIAPHSSRIWTADIPWSMSTTPTRNCLTLPPNA